MKATRVCEFESCDRPQFSGGLCNTHRMQRYNGRPLRPIRPSGQNMTPTERFWSKVRKTDSCWLWIPSPDDQTYGSLYLGGKPKKTTPAHRFSYELAKGPIPDGLVIDHLCRVPRCVNPDHLEAVTQQENILRGVGPAALAAKASHCPQGHPYDDANTLHARGRRFCRSCKTEQSQARNAQHKAMSAYLAAQGLALVRVPGDTMRYEVQ